MRRSATKILLLLALAGTFGIFACGCSNTAYLAEREKLYTGADMNIEKKGDVPDEGDLKDQLDLLMKPEPNGKFLGLFRLKLWLYNIGFFKESLGEPPVLLQSVAPDRVANRMQTLLHNKGFFTANVEYKIEEDEKTADVQYSVTLDSPYRIKSIDVKGDTAQLLQSVRASMGESLIHIDDPYDLDKLKLERERIDNALKEKGYFHFAPDFLLFQADSSIGEKKIDLTLRLKRDIPVEATRIYTIGEIYIHSGYSLNRDSVNVPAGDTIHIEGCNYIDLDNKFDPDVIVRSIFFRKTQTYSRENHDLTLNRLMNLGVFKFVNVRFDESDSAGIPLLNPHIYLTPLFMKSIRFELQGVSKSNNVVGPAFSSTFRNRNLLRGAELFKLSFDASFEAPISGKQSAGNSYQIGTRAELELPKFVTPFTLNNVSSRFVPKTRIALGFNLLHRLQYYQMLSVDASFGYNWKESLSKEHTFNPIAVTFAHLTNTTQKFEDILKTNTLLRRSFEDQFIIGPNYTFIYNDQLENDKNHLYFKGSIDFSGNFIHLVQSLYTKEKATPENPYKFIGTTYSQYSKFDIDLRHYYNTNDQTASVASRLIAGVGFAYGNSSTLPYVKQFYIGGSNSVRAFEARSLGPGSYKIPDSLAASSFIDQAGDIKLEANMEYRFPIVSILKGALFLDAGNIWLMQDDPNRPGAKFSGSTFLDEIAVGTGFGVRIDLSFFILRFDLAFPLHVPNLPKGERWVINKIAFGDAAWRKSNLVFNIAIGYPY